MKTTPFYLFKIYKYKRLYSVSLNVHILQISFIEIGSEINIWERFLI